MPTRSGYSVIIVPDDTGKVYEKKIDRWKVKAIVAAISAIVLCSLVFTFGFFKITVDKHRLYSLNQENAYLENKIKDMENEVDQIKSKMSELVEADENLRLVFDLPSIDPTIREVGVGGPDYSFAEFESEPAKKMSLVEDDIEKILRQIELETTSFQNVYEKIEAQRNVLDHTPSILPTEGIQTSGMGMRRDPFTGLRVMHKGIDIATHKGAQVFAPAAGIVEKSGWDRGMGNFIIINHGFNIKTYYGHLDRIAAKKGQRITRWDVIGYVGSTGRSTGPHLHYEVRKFKRPVNPREFYVKSFIFSS